MKSNFSYSATKNIKIYYAFADLESLWIGQIKKQKGKERDF